VLLQPAHAHEHGSQAQVGARGHREDGPTLGDEELRLLVGALQHENARPLAHVEQGKEIGDGEAGEVSL